MGTADDISSPSDAEAPASLKRPIVLLRWAQIHRFWLTPALMMAFWRQQRIEQAAAAEEHGGWEESAINFPLLMFSLYMAAWELPSGIIADGIGRRTSCAIGATLRCRISWITIAAGGILALAPCKHVGSHCIAMPMGRRPTSFCRAD